MGCCQSVLVCFHSSAPFPGCSLESDYWISLRRASISGMLHSNYPRMPLLVNEPSLTRYGGGFGTT